MFSKAFCIIFRDRGKAAIIIISIIIIMDQMTYSMRKRSLIVMNPERIFTPSVFLSSVELMRVSAGLGFKLNNRTVPAHSRGVVFQLQRETGFREKPCALPAQRHTKD